MNALYLLVHLSIQQAYVGAAYLRVQEAFEHSENPPGVPEVIPAHLWSGKSRLVGVPDTFPPPGGQIKIPAGKTHVEINIGTHATPIKRSDENAFLILVEPNPQFAQAMKNESKGDAIYQVAISNFTGDAHFNLYGKSFGSSSLSKASQTADWNTQRHEVIDVKVHTLKDLFDAIPKTMPITLLKTDLQGHDLTAIKSAGWQITRAETILSEVHGPRKSTYQGVDNSYPSWAKHMNKMGYDSGTDPRNGKPCRLLMDARDYAEQDCLFEKRNKRRPPVAKNRAKSPVL